MVTRYFRIIFLLLAVQTLFVSLSQAQTSTTIPIDSRGSYLREDEQPACTDLGVPCTALPARAIQLSTLGVQTGDTLVFEQLGAFIPGLPPFDADSATQMCGIFSSSSTLLGTNSRNRVPGAIDAGGPACNFSFAQTTLFGGRPINIAEDFVIIASPGTTVTVPAGAQFLFLAAPDSFYSDNRDPNHDFAVRITGTNVRKILSFADISDTSGVSNQTVRTNGIQWIDFNGDKKLDLFLVGSNGNALFKNIGHNQFTNVTDDANLAKGNARGASWADIDNDGDLDLFLATSPPSILINNNGNFVRSNSKLGDLTARSAATVQAGVWIDFDNDKQIDLFIVREGASNQLFKHTGFADFKDVSAGSGVDSKGAGRSAISADFNGDGYLDIYVVNFNQPNHLYLNNHNGTFTDSIAAKVGFSGPCLQAAVSDYDNDGDLDIFLANSDGTSILYKNNGHAVFSEKTPASLKKLKKVVAAAFADFDIDGDDDLVVAQRDGAGNFLFQNRHGKFKLRNDIDLSRPDNPSGISIGDSNNDGIPDIGIGDADDSQQDGDSIYLNTGGGGNNFLTIILKGKQTNRSAIGSGVIVQTGFADIQLKFVSSGNGQSQESLPLEFGLGGAAVADTIRIRWLSGKEQILLNVEANQTLRVTEK